MATLKIPNRQARALWLASHGLAQTPTGAFDLLSLIEKLGFVQLDTIQVIARAHHHILWSRNQNYRPAMLDSLMRHERGVFEHFTHDASVLPMKFLPMWQRQFSRMKAKVEGSSWHGKHLDRELLQEVRGRIVQDGPLCSRDFDTKISGERKVWSRPPHKIALDCLWYSGVLATCHRDGFTKYYDLAERVFPDELREQRLDDEAQVNWLCASALERIGFGSLTEIRKFWDAVDANEISDWAARSAHRLVPVEIEGADGVWVKAFAVEDIVMRLENVTEPTSRLRILNPFDPAIRDRARLKRLFGFDYTVEMFVPAAKRQWGYYVYPLLEGDRFIGRLEAKAERKRDCLTVMNLWFEPRVQPTKRRHQKLEAELERLARFAGLARVEWQQNGAEDHRNWS